MRLSICYPTLLSVERPMIRRHSLVRYSSGNSQQSEERTNNELSPVATPFTMEPLAITAAAVGITTSTLHCVRLLLDDLEKIADAPETLKSLEKDLLSVDQALTSLQTVSDAQWQSLGDTIVIQSKTATASCKESCDRFRAALGRWTRHSGDGKLSLRDRAMVGFLKQGYVKSMSEQLQHCEITLTSVVCTATL